MIPLLMTWRGRVGRDAVEFVNASSIESVTTTPVVVVCRVPDDDPAEGNRKCHNGRALGQTRAQAVRAQSAREGESGGSLVASVRDARPPTRYASRHHERARGRRTPEWRRYLQQQRCHCGHALNSPHRRPPLAPAPKEGPLVVECPGRWGPGSHGVGRTNQQSWRRVERLFDGPPRRSGQTPRLGHHNEE